ncbi:ABC transporter ATP-binding protein [Neopusillimonas maritima]|jgi:branched-chain amino acid transport system ATP-binding protein|uniref:ABC transporter ATP-binding protein n=1 Tax=Neopusillimonas maritima TaxID=2026239 RepID=A0ABX9MX01_9BURK|nr:ABC transporter ATP-binding protein [Neopusillimonas maritima]MAL00930.1 ABC transporter ATP-binding protein [Alcaligenaceae bacterium]RII83424.1 ABC transporter ATP-binding protein [Neopusillimonas maritima]|tara:strand:+ start:4776 stop:5480 length:705 start_codon:yes stop_codon:yes gene_type:complete
MLELKNVVCRYGKVNALVDVSLSVQQNELVTIIGANGAGKSTTLKAISGLLHPVEGTIHFMGEDITNASAQQIISMGISHCPEGRRVFPEMTVHENLEIGAYTRKDRNGVSDDYEKMYDMFPRLKERHLQAAGTLSGGEQQMLAIARSLMSRPKLIMFDEPSLGLAPNIVEKVFENILQVKESGTTVLMVEQNAFAALDMCDRAYLYESGHMTLTGTGKEMINDPHVRHAYLGG